MDSAKKKVTFANERMKLEVRFKHKNNHCNIDFCNDNEIDLLQTFLRRIIPTGNC